VSTRATEGVVSTSTRTTEGVVEVLTMNADKHSHPFIEGTSLGLFVVWAIIVMLIIIHAYTGFLAYPIKQQTGTCGANVSGDNNHTDVDCADKAAGQR
jgi:hypothetical protein